MFCIFFWNEREMKQQNEGGGSVEIVARAMDTSVKVLRAYRQYIRGSRCTCNHLCLSLGLVFANETACLPILYQMNIFSCRITCECLQQLQFIKSRMLP
jgi:hypothetical protein